MKTLAYILAFAALAVPAFGASETCPNTTYSVSLDDFSLASGDQVYLPITGWINPPTNLSASEAAVVLPVACNIGFLAVTISTAQPSGGDTTVTLYDVTSGSSTVDVVTIPASSVAGTYSSTTTFKTTANHSYAYSIAVQSSASGSVSIESATIAYF